MLWWTGKWNSLATLRESTVVEVNPDRAPVAAHTMMVCPSKARSRSSFRSPCHIARFIFRTDSPDCD